jgi:hypothetical protein
MGLNRLRAKSLNEKTYARRDRRCQRACALRHGDDRMKRLWKARSDVTTHKLLFWKMDYGEVRGGGENSRFLTAASE